MTKNWDANLSAEAASLRRGAIAYKTKVASGKLFGFVPEIITYFDDEDLAAFLASSLHQRKVRHEMHYGTNEREIKLALNNENDWLNTLKAALFFRQALGDDLQQSFEEIVKWQRHVHDVLMELN